MLDVSTNWAPDINRICTTLRERKQQTDCDIKLLTDIDIERRAGTEPAPPTPTQADEEVIAYLKAKMKCEIRARIANEKT